MILFKPQRWENSYFKTSLKAARTRFFTSRKKWTQVVESVVYVGDEHSPLGDLMVLFRLGLSSSAAVLNPSLCAEASLAHWCPHKMGDWFLSCEDNVCCAITHHWQPDPVLLQHKHRKKKICIPCLLLAHSFQGCLRTPDILWGQNHCCLKLMFEVNFIF